MMRNRKGKSCSIYLSLLITGVCLFAAQIANGAGFTPHPESKYGIAIDGALKAFANLEERWKSGDTNFPLIHIASFQTPGIELYTTVSVQGDVRNGSMSDRGAKGWGPCTLTKSNLVTIQRLIEQLPPSPAAPIPIDRQILVYGIRSNSWFKAVYDRADIPFTLETISGLACGRLEWAVPVVKSSTNIVIKGNGEGVRLLIAAANMSEAVSSLHWGGAILWDLEKWQGTAVSPFQGWWRFTNDACMSSAAGIVLSQDGKTLVIGAWDAVFALDLPITSPLKPRWIKKRSTPDNRSSYFRRLALIDGGKALAVASATRMEKWSLQTGEFQSVLSTNMVPLEYEHDNQILASSDGKLLVADMGGGRLQIWRPDWTNAPVELKENAGLLAISSDGRNLALKGSGKLVMLDLKNNDRLELPFRGCDGFKIDWGAWSPDGRYFAVTGCSEWPCIYDTKTWKPLARWAVPTETQYWSGGPCGRLTFSSDGTLISDFGDCTLWALKFPLNPDSLKLSSNDW